MRGLLLAVVAIAGCYRAPSTESCRYRCGGANSDACPAGLTCTTSGMCAAAGESCDDIADASGDDMTSACSSITFTLAHTLPVTMTLADLLVFDASSDGTPDIVVLNAVTGATSMVTVITNESDFAGRDASVGGDSPTKFLATKLTSTGTRDDLLVVQQPTQLRTLANNGARTFATVATSTGFMVNDVASIDLDGDADDDLLVLTDTQLVPHIRASAVMTNAQTPIPAPTAPRHLVVGDFYGDMGGDIAILNATGVVQFQRRTGTATWTAQGSDDAPMGVKALVAGRLTAAGPDMVLAVADTMRLFRVAENSYASIPGGAGARDAVFVDLDGDGDNDLVTANAATDDLSILINNGDGTFTTAPSVSTGAAPLALASADFDDDGRLDLAVANDGANNVQIFLNTCTP